MSFNKSSIGRFIGLLALVVIPPTAQANDGIVQGELGVYVREFATVPARADGAPARLNMLTHADGKLFAVASLDGLIYEIEEGKSTLWADLAEGLVG